MCFYFIDISSTEFELNLRFIIILLTYIYRYHEFTNDLFIRYVNHSACVKTDLPNIFLSCIQIVIYHSLHK